MESYDRGRRVSRQGENGFGNAFSGIVLDGYGGEGGRFTGLHVHATEVDCAAERALDSGFEEIQLAHGDAAAGDDDVDFAKGVPKCLLEGTGSSDIGQWIPEAERRHLPV